MVKGKKTLATILKHISKYTYLSKSYIIIALVEHHSGLQVGKWKKKCR